MQDSDPSITDPKNELVKKLNQLFIEAGRAHHEAFAKVGGDDIEWPIWYAEYLQEGLSERLGREMTRSEIIYCLVALSRRHPDKPWTEYYAEFFADHYANQ